MLIEYGLAPGIGRVFAVAVFIAITAPAVAHAGGVTMQCARADVEKPAWNAPVTFAFEGDERGTFKISGVFGAFTIPGFRQSVKTRSGKTADIIHGEAKAHVEKLPALSDVEACIDKIPGARSGAANSDDFLDARDKCMRELPAAPSGVDVVAQIRLGIDGESGADDGSYMLFTLIYDGPSRAPDGKMTIEVFPGQCTLKK